MWQAVLPLLNRFARVPVCGLIAQYNAGGDNPGPNLLPATMREILSKSLTLRGFINYEFASEHFATFLKTVSAGIADGRIRYREDITDGFENAPATFLGMLEGKNFGKTLIRVATNESSSRAAFLRVAKKGVSKDGPRAHVAPLPFAAHGSRRVAASAATLLTMREVD